MLASPQNKVANEVSLFNYSLVNLHAYLEQLKELRNIKNFLNLRKK
jgi:hypothetical protein